MKKLSIALASILALAPVAAFAASVVVTLVVPSATSTSITCTPVANPPAGTLAAGFAVCPIAILPAGWSGAVTVSDTTHYATVLVGSQLTLVTAAALAPGSYPVTLTSTP